MAVVTVTRVQVGREVHSLGERADGIELEGRSRLRPGHDIEIVLIPATGPPIVRRAVVWSWSVVAVGRNGPVFRGLCHWT